MTTSSQPTGIGIILVGDELLSGKRRDKHLPAVIDRLAARRLELDWVQMVGDDAARLEATLSHTLAGSDLVFSFGGIGPTPDDRTRQCAARAAGRPLEVNREGRAELVAHYGEQGVTPTRVVMVEWPEGARVIPNPINRVPGFSLHHHHFVPGFPSMAWPMVEWVLDTQYAYMQGREPVVEYLLEAHDTPESTIIGDMQAVMDSYPDVRIGCLPNAGGKRLLEFGVRGVASEAATAYEALAARLQARGIVLARTQPPL